MIQLPLLHNTKPNVMVYDAQNVFDYNEEAVAVAMMTTQKWQSTSRFHCYFIVALTTD